MSEVIETPPPPPASPPGPPPAPAPAPTPESDWPKVLEWAEKHGTESIKTRFATAELIAKEAQTTLTVLLAGIGGSAAYASKLFEPGPASPLTVGFADCCLIVKSSYLLHIKI